MKKVLNNTAVRTVLVIGALIAMIAFAYTDFFLQQPPLLQSGYIGTVKLGIGAIVGFNLAKVLFPYKVNWSEPLMKQSTAGIARIIFALFFAYMALDFGDVAPPPYKDIEDASYTVITNI